MNVWLRLLIWDKHVNWTGLISEVYTDPCQFFWSQGSRWGKKKEQDIIKIKCKKEGKKNRSIVLCKCCSRMLTREKHLISEQVMAKILFIYLFFVKGLSLFFHEKSAQAPQIQSLQNLYSFFLPAPTLAFAVPLTFFILFLLSFRCFLEVFFSHAGHVLQAYVWAHSSSPNPRNRKSFRSQLSCHHQNGFWIQIQRWHLVWSCTFWPVFPKFLF